MDKILGYVELGQKQGAKLVTGGKRVGDKGFFVEPTIFDNVKDDMAIAKDEIFGPVVSVLPFKSVRRGDRAGQQHLLRPGRRRSGRRTSTRPTCYAKRRQGRHGVGELLPRRRHDDAVRRLQDVRPGPRERRSGAGALHRAEDGDGQAGLNSRVRYIKMTIRCPSRWLRAPHNVAFCERQMLRTILRAANRYFST